MEPLFYLRDSRANTGNNVVFWRKNGAGYATGLDELEVFTLEQAKRQNQSRSTDVPLLKSLVDKLSISAIDVQRLPAKEVGILDEKYDYVVSIVNQYNGNDILFISHNGKTFNYNKALVFSAAKASQWMNKSGYEVYRKSNLDKIARQTFQANKIRHKTMTTDFGFKPPKKERLRYRTGKARGNCPACGKITWGYDPHTNAYCEEHK